MKAVELLLNSKLPPDLRDPARVWDSKSINGLLAQVAQRYPDKYPEIVKAIMDTGRHAAWRQGETLTLQDTFPVVDKAAIFAEMDKELADMKAEIGDGPEYVEQRKKIWLKYSDRLEKETLKNGLAQGNNIAMSVAAGARGKPSQLKMMVTAPAVYQDAKGDIVPFFIRNSFAQGLRPAEYLASTFGARGAVIAIKKATAKGGDWLKQATQASDNIVVREKDCGTDNGIDLPKGDESLYHRVLGRAVGNIPAGTILDRDALAKLRKAKVDDVIVRSPLTCTSPNGICAKCAGAEPNGRLPRVGTSFGTTAASALGEPITQGALGCLREGTLVRMADWSVRPIEHIKVGEWVLGADVTGRTFPVQVTYTWDQGMQPVYRYTYHMGQTKRELYLESTSCHPVLSNTKKSSCKEAALNQTLRKIPAGYKCHDIAAVLATSHDAPGLVREPLAVLLGVFLGDGIRFDTEKHPHHGVKFSCADPKLISDLRAFLQPHGITINKRKRSHDWEFAMLEDPTTRDSVGRFEKGFRSIVKRKLIEWGMDGKYAHEKQILPSILHTWDRESLAALVAGYLATDGCICKVDGWIQIHFGSTSKQLLEDVQFILEKRLCVYTTAIGRGQRAGTGFRKHDIWKMGVSRISDVRALIDIMPAIPGVKGARSRALLKSVTYRRNDVFYRCKRRQIEELGLLQCHDISVGHPDELFVLANGLIVKNSKHGGGVASAKKDYSGFNRINQFTQAPEAYPDRAAVAQEDGVVEEVKDAPQGGKYIVVNGEEHYAGPGYEVMVKPGQKVEAGQQLADGLVDVADVVRLRGLGEGRRYYAERLKQMLDDSDMKADRRNVETLARAAVDHLVVTDAGGYRDYLPDDVASYNRILRDYQPEEDTKPTPLAEAKGLYLQAPVLHYSVGTRLQPSMIERLRKTGFTNVMASKTPAPFVAEMERLRSASHHNSDWIAAQNTSYLKRQLGDAAARGEDTNVKDNDHFAPTLAHGLHFADDIETTGTF